MHQWEHPGTIDVSRTLIKNSKLSKHKLLLEQDDNAQIGVIDEVEEGEYKGINIGRFGLEKVDDKGI